MATIKTHYIDIVYEEYCEDPQLAIAILEHHRKEVRTLRAQFTAEDQLIAWLKDKLFNAEQFTIVSRKDRDSERKATVETFRTNRGKGTLIYH